MPGTRLETSGKSLRMAVADGNVSDATDCVDCLPGGESARAVAQLHPAERSQLFELLAPQRAAGLIEELSEEQAAPILGRLRPAAAAAIVERLPSDEQADLLGRLDTDEAQDILGAMEPLEAADTRELLKHGKESAGGLMIREYLSYSGDTTVEEILDDLGRNAEHYRGYETESAFVIDRDSRLLGAIRLHDLLLADRKRAASAMARAVSTFVHVDTPLDKLIHFLNRHRISVAPVLDVAGRLRGVVRRQDAERAAQERASRTLLKFSGIFSGEELRSMPLAKRCGQRLSWLTINLVLNIAAVAIIALYQDTLATVIALAVLLPVISDMGGTAGVQAIAVSMRELTLGLIRPGDFWYVVRKELAVALIGAAFLGVTGAFIGYLWQGNATLGVVAGFALALNIVVAACAGGALPLLLQQRGYDPAMASGPVVTTIADMFGFFVTLAFARAALPYLVT